MFICLRKDGFKVQYLYFESIFLSNKVTIMYLAPLNYDRFFKKVFSDLNIAQSFLEDFLDIKIESIERIKERHKITDDAAYIEFDFRCKINGHYVIIDMQQWYKAFVVKRFYLYQCLNSALQLEDLPKYNFPDIAGKKIDKRMYSHLLPTITLIWMTDDCLGFDDDFIAFAPFPEQTAAFFRNDALWASKDFEKLSMEREKILTLLNNNTKDLAFLPRNRMIYAFQKNIVKNKKLTKYFEWFELAQKTHNKNNVEEDFVNYYKNKTLMAVIERIKTENFEYEERSALEDLEIERAYMAMYRIDAKEDVRSEVLQEVRAELTPKLKAELTPKLKEDLRGEVMKEAKEEAKEDIVINAFLKGLDIELIASITNLPLSKVQEIIANHKES